MLGGGAHFRDRFHKVFQFPIMLQVNKDLQEIQSHQDRLLLKQQLEWLRTRTNRKRLARLEQKVKEGEENRGEKLVPSNPD